MREIKHRLRIGNKIVGYEKWYAGKSETEFDKTSAKAQWLYSTDGEYWNPEYIYHTHKDCFTGLKDKHGKEIYEGDILRNNRFNNSVAVVEWTNDTVCKKEEPVAGIFGELKSLFGFFTKLGAFELKHIKDNKAFHIQDTEIIGNIYENPELLDNNK